ncbi:hypothetical protein [Sciscionella sediminilitoris]|uniref:hypothetical protein n=1 Tax=Sciscionella sediminilitoris TaxID=1445613 RepID=UPI0005652F3B|nr:hypothetical protein [Sciscionella sp. SE31]
MSEYVAAEHLRGHAYAATVHDGRDITHHRITVSTRFLDDLLFPEIQGTRVVEETLRYLLEREPGVAIPHELDLDVLRGRDARLITELRNRLAR